MLRGSKDNYEKLSLSSNTLSQRKTSLACTRDIINFGTP